MKFRQQAAQLLAASTPLLTYAEDTAKTLPEIVVTAHQKSDTGQDSVTAAEERIQNLPGAGSILTPDQWTGRTIAPQEIFQFEPAVFARSRGTGNDTRISVRDSGLQRRFGDRGLSLLLDGIPANDADGSFYYRAIDPLTIHHLEIYPGANGLAHGGLQLGGAINIVQKNGLNTPGTRFQGEWGSFETYRGHLSHGGSNDTWDWFLSTSYSESGGYRERNSWENYHYTANLGYHWSDQAVTRFYFLYSDSDAALTGSLTREQFLLNPRQAQPGRAPDVDRDLATLRFGQRTEWESQNGRWSFYTNYQALDFDHLINRDSRFGFNRLIDYETDEFQLGAQGEYDYRWLGVDHTLRFNTAANYGRNAEKGFTTSFSPVREQQNIDRDNIASNFSIYLENDAEFIDHHHLILGLGYQRSRREIELNAGDETGENEGTLTDDGLVYRIGYLYKPTDALQVFANYSQSFEASPFAEAGTSLNFARLDPQVARTFEIGTRYQNHWADAKIALYHSDVKDEFIDAQLAPGGPSRTTNLDATHRGVEASLSLDLTELMNTSSGPRLFLDQSYQLNDFTIDDGPDRGNSLPGVAEHVYSGRLRLKDRNDRWNISLSAEWLPEGIIVDNANSDDFDVSGFTLWRLSGEAKLNDTFTIYGGVDNLFDKNFVNSATVNPSIPFDRALGRPNPDLADFINPGDGRSVYLGLKMKW